MKRTALFDVIIALKSLNMGLGQMGTEQILQV